MPDGVRVGPYGAFRRLAGNGPLLRRLAGGTRRPDVAVGGPLAESRRRSCPRACLSDASQHASRTLAEVTAVRLPSKR